MYLRQYINARSTDIFHSDIGSTMLITFDKYTLTLDSHNLLKNLQSHHIPKVCSNRKSFAEKSSIKVKTLTFQSLVICHDFNWNHRLSSWRHQMEKFSALLAICAGNSVVPGEFPTQQPFTRSFDVFFDLRPYKRLSKQWWGWWFETPWFPLWLHCNVVLSHHSEDLSTIYFAKHSFPTFIYDSHALSVAD